MYVLKIRSGEVFLGGFQIQQILLSDQTKSLTPLSILDFPAS